MRCESVCGVSHDTEESVGGDSKVFCQIPAQTCLVVTINRDALGYCERRQSIQQCWDVDVVEETSLEVSLHLSSFQLYFCKDKTCVICLSILSTSCQALSTEGSCLHSHISHLNGVAEAKD